MDIKLFLEEFQDYLAPKLDTYEQAIYLYVFRHSKLLGADDAVIGFKSARKKLALGAGEVGKPMGEPTVYKKLESLRKKGVIEIIDSQRKGTRVRIRLPSEIPGIVPSAVVESMVALEEIDFFVDPACRPLILEREGGRCFYCLRSLSPENYVLDHVMSRPEGNNSYKNLVAACRACNNSKGSDPDSHLQRLYRENFLTDSEFRERRAALEELLAGRLRPRHPHHH